MSTHRLVAALALLLAAVGVLVVPVGSSAARAADDGRGSAVTVHGTGRFSGLSVTVSQTEHLINQVVDVTWSGGEQTAPTVGNFNANYLQIMQCWGDGPDVRRENCQFGGLVSDTRGGNWAASRQVSYGTTLTDPHETYRQQPGSFGQVYVPFESVTGVTSDGPTNAFFDAYSTNEIPFGRTHADGTGEEHLEIQTAREAPGLGCGERLADGAVRGCWLVVVPRDTVEVDGQPMRQRLESSPLSASNWANHLSIPLHFDPVGLACPIGTPERRLVGQEPVADAVSRWQPVLCSEAGSIFGFSQIGDNLARLQTLADDPWMSFVSEPVDPAAADGRNLVYAPTAISGIGISFNIDRVASYDAPDDVRQSAGTRITSINLTPRLVAKLLTQSYRLASLNPGRLGDNPLGLASDPEFIAINPEFEHLDIRGLASITVPAGQADAYAELWRWVASDDRARVFLDGDPDPWGMKVNPAYVGLDPARSDFPVNDLECRSFTDGTPDLCPLDYLAYAQDMHDATRAAARGSTLARASYNPDSAGGWKLSPPQLSGARNVLALTDTATAERYRLPMASLQTGRDSFVAPTTESLSAGVRAMTPSGVAGVLESNPTPADTSAYPLTHVSYAVTAPDRLSGAESTAYGRFLRYVATDGQVPGIGQGQLPPGYVPLPDDMRRQTLAVAQDLARAGGGGGGAPSTDASDPPSDAASPGAGSAPPSLGSMGAGPGAGGAPPPADVPGAAAASPSAGPSPVLASASYPTPAAPVGPQRFLLAALLVAAAALLAGRPLVDRLGGPRPASRHP